MRLRKFRIWPKTVNELLTTLGSLNVKQADINLDNVPVNMQDNAVLHSEGLDQVNIPSPSISNGNNVGNTTPYAGVQYVLLSNPSDELLCNHSVLSGNTFESVIQFLKLLVQIKQADLNLDNVMPKFWAFLILLFCILFIHSRLVLWLFKHFKL